MQPLSFLVVAASAGRLFQPALAAPAQSYNEVEKRGNVQNLINQLHNLGNSSLATSTNDVLNVLSGVVPTATAMSPADALATLSSIYNTQPTPASLYAALGEVVAAGLTSQNAESALQYLQGVSGSDNSITNVNTRNPSPKVFPKAGPKDAPYDLSEAAMRAVIHIPSTFRYGAKDAPQPIILVPGTGATGYETFSGNMIPLLQGSDVADPVWLNMPGQLLGDAQTYAEYIAYAINYIHGISNHRKVAVATWSQGGLDTQWALKYWPSTRSKVTDFVAFSPDYHGTVLAGFISKPGEPLPPSVLQQRFNSAFVQSLRADNGDSAYVPTTTIYSGFFDEIVEPQQGNGASAYINDVRNVGASNNEVQVVCAGQAAGGFYTHEGVLYNPLSFALLKDALAHAGPGQTSRLSLGSVCSVPLAPGLDLVDFLETENAILIAGLSILAYEGKVFNGPALRAYAR